MTIEWLLFGALLCAALRFAIANRPGSKSWRLPLLLVSAALALGVFWFLTATHRVADATALAESIPAEGRPGGYVSSDKCRACHEEAYTSWHRSYHRTMTQVASPETVLGDFNDVALDLGDATFQLERSNDHFWVELPVSEGSSSDRRTRKRIGLLTGFHHMQVYWLPPDKGNKQQIFPFAWLNETQRWVPFHDTFLRDPSFPPVQQSWNSSCITCHATGGQPRPDYRNGTLETRVGELGIACEACHGPAEAHVAANQNPLRRNRYWAGNEKDPTIVNPKQLPSKRSSEVCGQCHSIKWMSNQQSWSQFGLNYRPGHILDRETPVVRPAHLNEQPWLREPLKRNPTFIQDRFWPDGMVRVSGREYNGLIETPCFQRGEMSCLSCHSMHRSDPNDQLAAGMKTNEACFQCHEDFRARIERHSHHTASSSGSLCYNCHMPHTTYGLLKAIRSHQIDSPATASFQATGRPTACNLCHLDKTLEWTGRHLTEWYGQPAGNFSDEDRAIASAAQLALRGDAGQRALVAWSMGWPPARQASRSDWLAPFLAELLNDPYAAVRYIAGRSLRRLNGFENLDYDYLAEENLRKGVRGDALRAWRERQKPVENPAVLVGANGGLNQTKFAELLSRRDNKRMDLQE